MLTAHAQAVKTYISRTKILIGEPIRLDITVAAASQDYTIDFAIPDSVDHFTIIEKDKRDTTDAGAYALKQTILFTSFDSGSWRLPAFPITVSQPGKTAQSFLSDSVMIQVDYAAADSTGLLRDIKPVMDVLVLDNRWIYYSIAAIVAIIIAFLLYRYWKKRPKKARPIFDNRISPFDEAMQALQTLGNQSSSNVKAFYSTLGDVFKRYYSRKTNGNIMAHTSGEIIMQLKTHSTNQNVQQAADVLRLCDAVKFAKYQPLPAQNMEALETMKQLITQLEKN